MWGQLVQVLPERGVKSERDDGAVGQQGEHGRESPAPEEHERQDGTDDRHYWPPRHEVHAFENERQAKPEHDPSDQGARRQGGQPGHRPRDAEAEPEQAGDDRRDEDRRRRDGLRMRDGRRGNRLHRLHGHRRAEVDARRHGEQTEAEKDALGVETIDRDIADDERNKSPEITEGSSDLRPVEVVPGESHEVGVLCYARHNNLKHHRSSLARRKERVGPRAVIGGVDDSDDVGEPGSKKTFNALPDGDLGKATSLTAAFKADVYAAFGDGDQVYPPAVSCDGGVHVGVEDLAHALGEITGGGRRGSHPGPHDAHVGHLRHGRTEKRLDV